MPDVDVSIVAFRPDFALFGQLVASLAEQVEGLAVDLLVLDNSPDAGVTQHIAAALAAQIKHRFYIVNIILLLSQHILGRNKINVMSGRYSASVDQWWVKK